MVVDVALDYRAAARNVIVFMHVVTLGHDWRLSREVSFGILLFVVDCSIETKVGSGPRDGFSIQWRQVGEGARKLLAIILALLLLYRT